MNTILFDLTVCQPIGKSKFHGGGVYGYIVFEALAKTYGSNVIAYYDSTRFIPQNIINIISKFNIRTFNSTDISISNLYVQKIFDTLYTPLWDNKYFKLFKLNIPIIVTQHGLRALEMNRDKYERVYSTNLKDYVKSLIKQTPVYNLIQKKYFNAFTSLFQYKNLKIITVSEHSKASILHYFPFINKNNIKTFYSPNTSLPIEKTKSDNGKYYLIVSANRWLKNAYRAIQALDKVFSNHPEIQGNVIITGVTKDSRLLAKVINKKRFIVSGYLEREELERLYQNAYALIYPSLNEGFGYPPIEAMRYGVPVIASSFASISEICGDAPLYVNPYSIDEISMRIIELENQKIYDDCSIKSVKRYQLIHAKQESDLQQLVSYIISQ